MLATLNSKQIIDEIVKDPDNDPHDVLDISSDVVLASRVAKPARTLAPELTIRPEPKLEKPAIEEPGLQEPKIQLTPPSPATAPSVDSAVRATASDPRVARKRSSMGKWLGGAAMTFLLALGSAGATIVWETHGDTAKQMIATWIPALAASPSQATAATSDQATATAPQAAAADQPAEQSAAPVQAPTPRVQDAAAPAIPDATQSVQSMTRDLAAMAQQIEQLKANIAELKTGQEQMAREMAKPAPPTKPAEARTDPRAKLSAKPASPPVRKPKVVYTPAYAPAPIAPAHAQAAALPPPPPVVQPQVADDDGPIVRPPMPLH
jgi:hypothetical protein